MKKKSVLILMSAATFAIMSCQSNQSKEQKGESQEATTAGTANAKVDPDTTDSIPADGYAAYNSDMQAAEIIRKALTETILKDDLSYIPAEQRKFKYHAIDLNNDKSDEYLVALTTNYFCGTGGCSFYIVDKTGKLVSNFSVSDFPVYVAPGATDGWQDLIIMSNGKFHHIKMKGGKYPSNPSVEPEFKGEVPKTPALLNIYESAYPAFIY
jgi:hypothetical protein